MIIMNQRNFAKRSLKESKNDDIKNYIDDLRTYSKKDVPSYSKSYYFWSYYEFNISDNEWTKVSLSGRDYTKSLKDANNFAKSDDVVKAYLVFKNPNNPNENFKVIIKENDFYESKKSARKSIKESKVDFQSVIDKVLPKEYAKNKNAYRYALSCVTSLYNEDEYDSDSAKVYFLNCYISDLFPSWVDELGEEEIDTFANALYDGTMKWSDIDSSWFESEKSVRKSLKELTDESFSFYNLNKETKFVNKWLKQLDKNFENISVDSIYSNEIWFRLWVDEIPLKIRVFDEIATECMPKTLIEFIHNKNIDFNYEFMYKDDYMTINDFVFIKFIAW